MVQNTSCLYRLSLALVASHENVYSFNYFENLRDCVSYVASGVAASIQSSIALHAFRLYEFGEGTKQHLPRQPSGLWLRHPPPPVRPPPPPVRLQRPCDPVAMTRAACIGAAPPPKFVPAITSSPKLYKFLNPIPFLFLFIGEGRAPPWPMGSDHLSGECCVLTSCCHVPVILLYCE
jgi:hypothetical protein